MANDYKIKKEWTSREDVQVFVAKAVSPTGRILGKVTVDMDLITGFDLKQYYGESGVKAVEESAVSTLKNLVEARQQG